MKIEYLEIKNYKQFADLTLDLTYPKGHEKEDSFSLREKKLMPYGMLKDEIKAMKKIDKSKILSDEYFKWMKALEEHPKYSSSHKYIKDIKMNLLYCQNGLCDLKLLEDEDLVNGDLEYFDCTLKENKAYLWNNLFMVNSNINCRVKDLKEDFEFGSDLEEPSEYNTSGKMTLQNLQDS